MTDNGLIFTTRFAKAELIKLHGPWRTRRQLEIAIFRWITCPDENADLIWL